jgi:hypothetical protein
MDRRSLSQWFQARLWSIADQLAAALVITGLALIVTHQLSRRILLPVVIVTIIFPITFAGFMLLRPGRLRAGDRRVDRTPIADSLDFSRLALDLTWRTKEKDFNHRFAHIEECYAIEELDGLFEYHYRGTNVGKDPSLGIRETISGDCPIDIERLDIRAEDVATGAPLTWDAVRNEPYTKTVMIRFPTPVQPGGCFDIKWSCRWPGTFARNDDYVFFTFRRRQRGVEYFRGTLQLARSPSFHACYRYYGSRLRTELLQPVLATRDGKSEISFELENPPPGGNYVYLIEFRRTDL